MRLIDSITTRLATAAIVGAALLASPAAAQERDRETVDVAGMVSDATTGAPVSGALIQIAGTSVRTLTNEMGRFVLREVPAGQQTWVIERLGYATWTQPLTARHLDQLRIGLMARPVALEAIRASVDRLEARRKLAPYSVHTISRENILSAVATDAGTLARARMPWVPAWCPIRTAGGARPVPGSAAGVPTETSLTDPGERVLELGGLCIRYRGDVVQPGVCLDDKPVPLAVLSAYGATEIHAIDYVGGPNPQVRLYTRQFLESGERIRPMAFGCH